MHARSRHGSYIAEAAVVLPFVFLSILTAVMIVMFFYESSVTESQMHMALRCEAGLLTETSTSYSEEGTVLSSDDIWRGNITSSGLAGTKQVSASADVSMVSKGLLSNLGRRRLSASVRALDPTAMLRLRQIIPSEDGST